MPDMMGQMDIAFPHLGIYLKNVPKNFQIFGFTIALYGVLIALGLLLALTLISHIANRTGQKGEDYWDIGMWVMAFGIIGARIYYVVFAWDNYKDNPIEVFHIRGGGLAIYGGVIAGFATLFVITRIKKMNFLLAGDTIMYGLLVGQIIGRWGNFTNREAFGQYTDGLFAMRLPVAAVRSNEITESIAAHMSDATNYIQVHPTYLYEGMWNLALLCLMLLYLKHKKFVGENILFYLGGYGLGRFFVESLRTDQLHFMGTDIAVSQVLGITLFAFAVITDVIVRICLVRNCQKNSQCFE